MSVIQRPPLRLGVECPRGHDDWYVYGHRGRERYCRPCKLAWDRNRRLERGLTRTSPLADHCHKGHEFATDNTLYHKKGDRKIRLCRICTRAKKRAYTRRHSARLAAKARQRLEEQAAREGRTLPSYTPRGGTRAVCVNGHDRLEPGALKTSGRSACRKCANEAARRRRAELKAKARAYDVVMAELGTPA